MLLKAHKPVLASTKKKQLMTVVDGVKAKRMALLDYQLVVRVEEHDLVCDSD